MHKIYNKELNKFRLNPISSLLRSTALVLPIKLPTLHLYLGPNQSLFLNDWKDHLAFKVSGN